ncbi:MAG: DUF692 domain-containing protein [Alphaproteobacteria bacterium]
MPAGPQGRAAGGRPLPVAAGIGLRHKHMHDFLAAPQPVGWVEVHSENFLGDGGPRLAALETIRRDLPVSCHGVGLSLGTAEGLDRDHLARLARLFARIEPAAISEHVAWSVAGGVYLNDLLPLPWTEEALDVLCRNIDAAQEAFGRRLLVENPSSYLSFPHSTMPEWQFIAETVRRTGCGLLLDVNNVYVSARNHGFASADYLAGLPLGAVEELHLAGHSAQTRGGETVLIDDHGSPVCTDVWALCAEALARTGPLPTLIEWDTDIPPLPVLLAEAAKADRVLARAARLADVA